ncbi:hypothetical protein [Robinsoniella peoriensis]|uniref:hypothetical protein n=1 Tax=Robinsoniella peoriensis TaxID=180332 RepID=UPI003642B9EB
MRFINPDIDKVTLMKDPKIPVTEVIRKIICDKYGLEGDSEIDNMIDDIYTTILKIEI